MQYIEKLQNGMFDISRVASLLYKYVYRGHVIGLGANILNGYSYEPAVGGLTYLSNCPELVGNINGVYQFVYIKDYREPEYGFENCVSTPERTICDFLMYPEELEKDLWVYDAIEGYIEDDETPDNLTEVYNMMDHFGIDRQLLDELLPELFPGD